jgi:hypothetical protein
MAGVFLLIYQLNGFFGIDKHQKIEKKINIEQHNHNHTDEKHEHSDHIHEHSKPNHNHHHDD